MTASFLHPMVTGFTLRRVAMIGVLVASWCVLWGSLSAANVISGTLLALAVSSPGLGDALPGGVRPVPLAHLTWLIFVDLTRSTIKVASEVLSPSDHTSESIVAVTIPPEGRRHMLLYTAAVTLTPGTVVVDVDMDAGTLYVHLLHDANVSANGTHIQRLAELASRAFPVAGERAAGSGEGR